MGETCSIILLKSLDVSNWIDIISIIVNSGLAIWFIFTVQSRQANQRVLKDHFISEIKDIRDSYKSLFSDLYSNKLKPKLTIPWFKSINLKINDLFSLLEEKYDIEPSFLEPFQVTLRDLITDNEDFTRQYNLTTVKLSEASIKQLMIFEQDHNHRFNVLIMTVNDSSTEPNVFSKGWKATKAWLS